MVNPISLPQLVEASIDADAYDIVVNGGPTSTVVNRAGNTLPSVAKFFADREQQITDATARVPYTLYDDMYNDASNRDKLAIVHSDPWPPYNGQYYWDEGFGWRKTVLQPSSKEVTDMLAQSVLTAQATATNGVKKADAAQNTANLAGDAAELAQTAADQAGLAAEQAHIVAKTGVVKADNAQLAAESAYLRAGVAQSGVDAVTDYLGPEIEQVGLSERIQIGGGYAELSSNKKLLMKLDAAGYYYERPLRSRLLIPETIQLSGQRVRYFDAAEYELSGLDPLGEYVLSADRKLVHAMLPIRPVPPEPPAVEGAPIRSQQIVPAILGDSRSANAASPNPQGLRTQVGGWPFWAEMFSMGGFRFDSAFNFAVAGQTSTQIVTRAEQAAKSGANCVIYHAEVNDALGEDSIGNAIYARDLCLAEGKPFIIIAETPRGITSPSNWNAARRAQHARYRETVLSWRGIPGVRVIDVMPAMIDPYSAEGGFKALLSPDQLHYSCHGSLLFGWTVVDGTKDMHVPIPGLVVSNADIYDAVDNPRGNLLSNGLMAGTTGTHTGTGSIVGPVADGWSLNSTGSYSGTSAKELIEGREWQRITFSGTAANASQEISLLQSVPVANLAAGDLIECMIEVAVDAGSVGMYGPELNVKIDGSDSVLASGFMIPSSTVSANPTIAYSGLIRTPRRYAVQAGIASMAVHVRVRGRSGEPMSGSFRVTAASIRKII